MNRFGYTLLAATALTLSMGGIAMAQSNGSDSASSEADCPEDMNTDPGCQLEGAEESERQPVEGAATAPVEGTDGGDSTTTMTGADTEGDGGAPETDGETSDAASNTDAGDNAESGGTIEDGAMETAPTPADGDAPAQGEVEMEQPEADPDSEPQGGEASEGSEEQSDASDMENADEPVEAAEASGDANIQVAYEDGGRYYTEDDVPTFHVAEDGTVDWLTFSGFRRYHAECHVCHGPDGEGSTYAPAIKNSAVNMDYYDFYDVVVNGRKNGNSVMPHFGDNPNVMCYLDDIYVYLKARGAGAVDRGRPAQKEAKSDMIQEAENVCMG